MKVSKTNLSFGETPMGNELSILKYEIDSEVSGKTFYIQSGVHGGEITQWVLHDLFNYLKEHLKRGKVILIPNANPVSWLQRTYFSTNGKFDFYMGKDWNRNFPGNLEGSLGERISATLFEEAKQADFVLDLHTSRESIPFSISFSKAYDKYVKILGIEYNQFLDLETNKSYSNTLNAGLHKEGIPSLCVECGSHDAYEPENIKDVFEGIKNLLKHFELVDGKSVEHKEIKLLSKSATYRAEKGGIIRLAKKLGESVNVGEDLYYLYDNNDLGNIQTIKSAHRGILFKISPTHIYWSGDEVVQILLDD